MAITSVEKNVVARAIAVAKKIMVEVKPELDRLDTDYNGAVNVDGTLTQADLDEVREFSGLTTTEVADGMFALTSTVRTAITNAFAALETLAVRG